MVIKSKAISGIVLTLLFVGMLPLAFDIEPVKAVATSTVTYDYYVVAGYGMVPTPPELAPSPPGFNFAVDPPVFNFRNVTYWGGRTYLYDGFIYSPYNNMSAGPTGARVRITNLLGYNISIVDLTAEVMYPPSTPTRKLIGMEFMYYNVTVVTVDTLDPWDPLTPPEFRDIQDECNYTTGVVTVQRLVDGDRYNKITGYPYYGGANQGPGSLLEPDWLGDANATGHVAPQYAKVGKYGNYTGAPIKLANGSTFTEYFGVIIFGDADADAQINGTITLSLTYEFTTQGPPVASFTYTPTEPLFNETVTFNASASAPNGGIVISYLWDFGDGTNGAGMIINHTYATPGNYTVILNVTDTEWLSTTNNQSIEIVSEFPSLLILPLFMIATLVTVVYAKTRKFHRPEEVDFRLH